MAQFTTSAKPIQSFCQTTLIDKLALAVGDRLEQLTQSERYQLAMCISTWLYQYCELEEDEDPEPLLACYFSSVSLECTGNVKACLFILKDEDADNLSAILPAISEYASNEYYEEPEPEEWEQMHEGESILTSLNNMLD